MEFVRLAGGLLWKEERVAVIHRPRQDDWSLPKGRVDAGESWEEAALREVEEETGCEARIRSFAGAGVYVPRRTPRIALYWNLELVQEGPLAGTGEVDALEWLEPRDAAGRLDEDLERRLVERALAPAGPARPSAEVAAARADLLRALLDSGGAPAAIGPALELLDRAEAADAGDSRRLLEAARRLALFALSGEELALQAQVLRARARGLAAWRSRAVRRILPKGARPSAEAVYVAAQVCDEEREPKGPGRRAWIPLGLIAALCGAAAGAAVAFALR